MNDPFPALSAAIRNAIINRNLARLNGDEAATLKWMGYIEEYKQMTPPNSGIIALDDSVAGNPDGVA